MTCSLFYLLVFPFYLCLTLREMEETSNSCWLVKPIEKFEPGSPTNDKNAIPVCYGGALGARQL